MELYLTGLSSPKSRDTMRACLNSVARLAGACDSRDLDWTTLTYPDLQILRARIGARYSPNTGNTMLAAVRGVLHAGWQLGQIDSEAYLRAKESIKTFRGQRLPRGRMLSLEEQAALFRVCAADPDPAGARDAAALALMLGAGLRKAEAASVTCEALDLDKGLLRIIGKGDKERLVPLIPETVSAIRAWLEVRGNAPGGLLVSCRYTGKDPSRWTERLVPLSPDGYALNAILERRCQQAGIARCTPHDLRRTFVSVLLGAGVDVFTVQQLAGHANPATTARYDRRGAARLKAAAHRMQVPYVGRN